MAIIEKMSELRTGDYVFPGWRAGEPCSGAVAGVAAYSRGLITHGFRSSFSDRCAERTNFSGEVRKMALAHSVDDKVEEAHRRGNLFDKRRQLAEAWGRYAAVPPELLPWHRQRARKAINIYPAIRR